MVWLCKTVCVRRLETEVEAEGVTLAYAVVDPELDVLTDPLPEEDGDGDTENSEVSLGENDNAGEVLKLATEDCVDTNDLDESGVPEVVGEADRL